MEHLEYLTKLNKNTENIKDFKFKFDILEFMLIGFDEMDSNEELGYHQSVLKDTIEAFVSISGISKYAVEDGVLYHNKNLTHKQQGYMKGYRSGYLQFGGF